ncbi:MAG TPA: LamG-like jellyroll fold domain-containing protein, partial [Armatimonadota bacterium]|nr:LamG-like jellyroll fold domain-containing protein [Armatimonadota bacterium]
TGAIHGAKWVRSGAGHALQFNGADDYVDCGNGPSLDLTGPLTLQLWAQPSAANRGEPGIAGKFFESYAISYYGNAHFYISSGGNNVSGPTKIGTWAHLAGVFDGALMRFYVNGVEVTSAPSKFPSVKRGKSFTIGCIFGDTDAEDPNLRNTAFFPGLIDDVRVHSRALSQQDVAECYNELAAGKGLQPFDTSRFGKLNLEPFFYPEAQQLVVSVNSRWVVPLPVNAEAVLELAPAGGAQALQTRVVNANAPRHEDEVTFSLKDLPPGEYEVRSFVRERTGVFEAEGLNRSSPQVDVQTTGWLAGKLDLRGGWAEYDLDIPEGEYHLAVLAARIYDSAGIRCTLDGGDPVEADLNGMEGGSESVWARTKWERIGRFSLTPGPHVLRIETMAVTDGGGKSRGTNTYIDAFALEPVATEAAAIAAAERVPFVWPLPPPPAVPAPEQELVGALPPVATPPPYSAALTAGGGLEVTVEGRRFVVESTYSYPNGGFNRLAADGVDESGEPGWRVTAPQDDAPASSAQAVGEFYTVERLVERQPTRIIVRDTIRNTSPEVLGVMLSNHIRLDGLDGADVTQMTNPTIFVAQGEAGLGLIALDDLYQLQLTTTQADGLAAIRDDHFGLDTGASYTVEWAIYPTAAPVPGGRADYYDFINQVRRDEGLDGRVEGTWGGMGFGRIPDREYVDLRRLRYLSTGTPWYPADDPEVSIEGIEFMQYPRECARTKAFFGEVKRAYPEAKVMIHVAHGLYCCNRPEQVFSDSRALDADGNQMDYGGGSEAYYTRYWSKERFADGWRWWIYYPTPENSFGKAMIEAMGYMMDEMGATALWADGYISGYVRGLYSYDRWDGHSVTIDPETKLVTRRKNLVPYASLPVLRDVIRLIADRGGVLITNGTPGPRSLWREPYVTSAETGGGDARAVSALHLGRTVTPLGNPAVIATERGIYRDILAKLDFGALYWWYGERDLLTHKTLVEHMYPITFESIHSGTVRGSERIVTKKSGIYGWPGDESLHAVYLYDARGALARHDCLTSIDQAGVRTRLDLAPEQSAAVVKIPVRLASASPVNVRVLQYDPEGVRLALNGPGPVMVAITDGDYAVRAGIAHRVTVNGKPLDAQPAARSLRVNVEVGEPCELRVNPAAESSRPSLER